MTDVLLSLPNWSVWAGLASLGVFILYTLTQTERKEKQVTTTTTMPFEHSRDRMRAPHSGWYYFWMTLAAVTIAVTSWFTGFVMGGFTGEQAARNEIVSAANAPVPVPVPPAPAPEVLEPVKPAVAAETVSERELAVIVKSPDRYVGKRLNIHGKVTMDVGYMGGFLANFGPTKASGSNGYFPQYGDMVPAPGVDLSNIVMGDQFKAEVTVMGMGNSGNAQLQIDTVTVTKPTN